MRVTFRSILLILLIGGVGGVVAWMVSRERAATMAQEMAGEREELVRLRTVANQVSERFPPAKFEVDESGANRIRAAIETVADERGVSTETVASDVRAFGESISALNRASLADQCLAHFANSDFQRVVDLSRGEPRNGDGSPDISLLTGHALSALGNDTAAAEAYRLALPPPDTGPGLAWARVAEHFAAALARAEKRAEALELWQQVLAIRKREQGGGHPQTLEASIATGRLKLQLCSPGERNGTLRALIADLEAREGTDAEGLPVLLDQLGDLERAEGNAAAAEDLYRHALNISEKIKASPLHAQRLLRLASFLAELGRLAEAEPFTRRAVQLTRKDSGPMSPSAAEAVDRLAKLLRARGERDQAEQILRKEMADLAAEGNTPDMRVAGHLFELACVIQDAGRTDEAEPLLRRALALARTSDPPAWEQEIAWAGMLARLLQVNGEMPEAEELYRSALAVAEEHYGAEHAGVVLPLNNLAVLLFDTGRHAEARETAARAYAVAKTTLGESDPQTRVCSRTLQGISDASAAAAATAAEKARTDSVVRPRTPVQR